MEDGKRTTVGDAGKKMLSQPHTMFYPFAGCTFPEWTDSWMCEYCGGLESGHRYSCANCGAPRKIPDLDVPGEAWERYFQRYEAQLPEARVSRRFEKTR